MSLLLGFLLVCAVGYYEYLQHSALPVAILVNGSPVCTAESLSAARSLLVQVYSQELGPQYLGRDHPRFVEDVEFQRAGSNALIDSPEAAVSKLESATHTVVDADVIVVDQKKIVALPDAQTAQQTVDELRDHYASMPPDDPLEEKPSFVQSVTIDRRTVPVGMTKTNADDAAALLWTPPSPKTYTVEHGETGWSIAKKFDMAFSDFLRANAGNDVNHLAPGDSVVISKTFPPVDVIVKKREEENQTFAETGVRQLTVVATYIDGIQVGTPVATSMITLHRANPQMSLQ
jgi:LysM repeat protein